MKLWNQSTWPRASSLALKTQRTSSRESTGSKPASEPPWLKMDKEVGPDGAGDLQLACRFGSPIKTMHRPFVFFWQQQLVVPQLARTNSDLVCILYLLLLST